MPEAICARCGVVKRLVGRGLCNRCHLRASAAGELDQYARTRLTFDAALALAKDAETAEGCWPYPTAGATGYSTTVKRNGRRVNAHTASYEQTCGPVPDGLTLDHLCHTNSECVGGPTCPHRRCVRPDHLEPVTPQEQSCRAATYRRGTCGKGHAWTTANTGWARDSKQYWYRKCRTCGRDTQRIIRARAH